MLTVNNKNVDWVNIPLAACVFGNCCDTYATLRIYEILLEKLEDLKMVNVYENLLMPAIPVFRDIELEGMYIDEKVLDTLGKKLNDDVFKHEEELYNHPHVKNTCNFKSTHDMVEILYSARKGDDGEWIVDPSTGFSLYPPGKTDKGQPSTSEESLTLLHTFIEEEIARRGLNVEAK